MGKIIKLNRQQKKYQKAREYEGHPDNQKYWNRVVDNMTIAHFGTLNPEKLK